MGLFKKVWKYLVNCLVEMFVLVRSINSEMETLVVTHLRKSLKYFTCLYFNLLELEKVFEHDLHLNLILLYLSLPQIIVFLEPHDLHEKQRFFKSYPLHEDSVRIFAVITTQTSCFTHTKCPLSLTCYNNSVY